MRYPATIRFQTIVIATDLTEASSPALECGRELAKAYGARVILTHVIDPVEYANLEDAPKAVLKEMTASARAEIEKRKDEFLAAGIPSHSEVRQGLVAQLLLQVIHQYKADLLVLGTKGGQGAGHLALGSIAEELVRQAPCAVLAVASDVVRRGTLVHGHVLMPMQRSTASIDAIASAKSVAASLGSDLLLLHVRTEEELSAQVDPCAASGMSFPQTEPRVPVRCLVRDGQVAPVIADTAEQYNISLMAMSVNRESRHRALGPHGTAYEVVARVKVPVLLFPPPAEQRAEDAAHQEVEVGTC
jgi:nucleotide-binding universal stress UspA family protein